MLRQWDDEIPGAHIVYADLLCPWLERLLESPDSYENELRRAFAVLEKLVSEGSQGVRDVVGASVCEVLAAENMLDRARAFMGPATHQLCDQP